MQFKTTRVFARAYKRLKKKYRKLENDIASLRKLLSENPSAGISLGSGLFKIRLASSDLVKGKSGGFRVVYYFMFAANTIVLLDLYTKSEREDVPISEIRKILDDFLRTT